jgi:hypothetical protein
MDSGGEAGIGREGGNRGELPLSCRETTSAPSHVKDNEL